MFRAPPRGRSPGPIYFISANLGTRGIATWAADVNFFRGVRGLIGRESLLFAMDKTARAVADPASGFAAAVFPLSGLARVWGLKTTLYGYAQSRACVK
jgi:hypothetical protein